MRKVLIFILFLIALTGCTEIEGEKMYIAIYGRDLKHITNVTDVKYEITERVFDLDTSSFLGITNIDLSNELIFVLCDNSGKQVYSGYIKGLKQAGNLVTFSGDDFKKGFDTEVILDYATGLNTAPKVLDEVFRDVSLAILSQHSEIQTIVPMDILFPSTNEDVLWIADYTSQYMTVNANRFLKTYLAYFGYFIDSYYDKINKKVILEIKSNVETASIRLDDFTHETTRNETLTNKAVANLKFNNINTGEKVWKYIGDDSGYGYDVTRTQNTPDPEVSANEYQVGVIMHIKYIPFQSPVEENRYYQAEYLTTLRPVDLPTRTYYLGNDNLIYESLIPQEKMILPIVSKVFEEEFFQTAQFNAVSELVNSRYNENIIITNSQTPVDLSKYDLYTMIKVYDKNGLMVEMPLAEIERTNGSYKIKLGFKKTRFTEIVKSLTEDAPIKSTGVSGIGGGGGITEGNVHSIIDSEVPELIEESKQIGTFPPDEHTLNGAKHTGNIPITRIDDLLDLQNKIYEHLIPAVAITDTFEASSQSAMIALQVQKGDICIRTDINKSFVLAQSPASTLVNWKELRTPTDAVLSVAGKTGAVSLNKSDVGLGNVDNTSDVNKPISTAVNNALAKKINDIVTYAPSEDPNTTQFPLILTSHTNCPGESFWYIRTYFYSTLNSSRSQIAYKYHESNHVYFRNFYNGVWTSWTKLLNSDEVSAWAKKTSLAVSDLPTVPISKGGTGATTASVARDNLYASAKDHTHSQYYNSEVARNPNYVLAGPATGGNPFGATFRLLTINDIPNIPQSKVVDLSADLLLMNVAIGSKAPSENPVFTGTPKVGTQNIVVNNDPRLTDARTPLTHYHDYSPSNHNHHSIYSELSHVHEYAPLTHSHGISQVNNLQSSLDGKQTTLVSGTNIKTIGNQALLGSGNLTVANIGAAAASHVHAISNVTSLQTSLDGKASTNHIHVISNVDNLQTTLNAKAPLSHNHSAVEITSGTLPVSRGGTGAGTFTTGALLVGNGASAITTISRTGIDNRSSFPPSSHTLASHTGTLAVSKGGTGQTTIAGTKTALGVPTFSLSGTVLTITL